MTTKNYVCFLALATLALTSPVLASDRIIIRPALPAFPDAPESLRPGSFLNPYEFRDEESGKAWRLQPEFPDFGSSDKDDILRPGSEANPWTIEED